MKKRILPVLLALCMVMSLLPVAFASDCSGSTPGDASCSASTHADGCPKKCQATAGCTETVVDSTSYCTTHICEKTGCTKEKSHTDAHSLSTCTGDDRCNASTHDAGCPKKCACENGTENNCNHDGGCTNSKAPDSNFCATCKENQPGGPDDGGDEEEQPDPEEVGVCGIGGCTLGKGHTDPHKVEGENIEKCLGYANDGRCSATNHIAGCPNYACDGCDHSQEAITYHAKTFDAFDGDAEDCTSKAGCPFCADWNGYVTRTNAALRAEYSAWKTAYENAAEDKKAEVGEPEEPTYLTNGCTCADCKPNPAMGVVTDENGNVVDPTDPTEPTDPEVPSKAEDFTDMEDWMAADVQVALDKGWLEGYGDGTFNGRGVTSGATIAAVLARMDGETITGGTWAMDALKWAADQDAFEGIDLTGDSMARKDLVLVIWRMAGKPAAEKELEFTDVDGLEGDHLTAMQWAVENGIVKGNGDGTVTPDGSVNRAALCAMLARYDALEK